MFFTESRKYLVVVLIMTLVCSIQVPVTFARRSKESKLLDLLSEMDYDEIQDYLDRLEEKLEKWEEWHEDKDGDDCDDKLKNNCKGYRRSLGKKMGQVNWGQLKEWYNLNEVEKKHPQGIPSNNHAYEQENGDEEEEEGEQKESGKEGSHPELKSKIPKEKGTYDHGKWHLGWYNSIKDGCDFGAIIIVEKRVEWESSPYMNPLVFQFKPSWSDEFSLSDGESKIFIVSQGTYSVSEFNGEWKTFYSIDCGDEKIGNNVEVTVENFQMTRITFINRPPSFVIPENPLGTAGLVVSFLVALGIAVKRSPSVKLLKSL